MGNIRKFPIKPVVILLSGIMMLGLLNTLSPGNVFSQTLHNKTLYEVGKQTSESDEISGINVGNGLRDMALSQRYNAETENEGEILYVSNYHSGSISVISVENNTVIEEIRVEDEPEDVAVGYATDPVTGEDIERVYVANNRVDEEVSDSVSVISIYENNTRIVEKNIPVDVAYITDQDRITTGYVNDPVTDEEIGIVYVIGGDGISLISMESNQVLGEIPLEGYPGALAPSLTENKVYVANGSLLAISISVNNTEVNSAIEEIPLENEPTAIAVDLTTDPVTEEDMERVYVTNYGSDSVSVISIYENNSKTVENIPVEYGPIDIAAGYATDPVTGGEVDRAYVANYGSDSVSVISIYENNSKTVENIPVQDEPTAIVKAWDFDTVYVANSGSDSVSVVDGSAKKAVVGVTFQVNPFNSGVILCDGLTTPSPIGQYTYVYSSAQCIAKPNEGFEFSSWVENLEGNSTQPISVSRPASGWDSFVLAVTDFFGDKPDNPESKLNITKFGTFTANFVNPVQFTIPWEFVAGLILGPIAGWSIPGIIGLVKSKRDVRKLNYYHIEIASLYEDGKLDEKEIEALDRLRGRVVDAYSEGKINDKHYESLRNEISTLYEKIFRKRINDSSNNNSSAIKRHTQEQLAQLRNDVEYAYSEGKINEKHYDLLNKAILKLDGKEK